MDRSSLREMFWSPFWKPFVRHGVGFGTVGTGWHDVNNMKVACLKFFEDGRQRFDRSLVNIMKQKNTLPFAFKTAQCKSSDPFSS